MGEVIATLLFVLSGVFLGGSSRKCALYWVDVRNAVPQHSLLRRNINRGSRIQAMLEGSGGATMRELNVGDILSVEHNDDGLWTNEWISVEVTSVVVLHNPRKGDELDPFVCVGTDHPTLRCFNYTLYCQGGHIAVHEVPATEVTP